MITRILKKYNNELFVEYKLERVVITVFLSILELIVYFHHTDAINIILSDGTIQRIAAYILPTGGMFFLNYYIIAPLIILLLCLIWESYGHTSFIKEIEQVEDKCTQWLAGMNVKWGPYDSANEYYRDHRIANMCEAELAIFKAAKTSSHSVIYNAVRGKIYDSKSQYGWYSRTLGTSLGEETVVCTSMALYLFALDRSGELNHDELSCICKHLWECRSENGWGVYVKEYLPTECRMGNTFWALRAINCYQDYISQKEFEDYVVSIYQKSNHGMFGYHINDIPSVCITAMFFVLLHELPQRLYDRIIKFYDIDKAIDYIYKEFCVNNIQCEMESLPGIGIVDKVPWQHITISYVLKVLSISWAQGKLSLLQKKKLINRVRLLIKENIYDAGGGKYYYHPEGMRKSNKGNFTYPSAYLIVGLYELRKALIKNKETRIV